MRLWQSILSQRFGADSSFSKEPIACGRDERRGTKDEEKVRTPI
jgi:hypothetical protein